MSTKKIDIAEEKQANFPRKTLTNNREKKIERKKITESREKLFCTP